jgi:hypothetical protein
VLAGFILGGINETRRDILRTIRYEKRSTRRPRSSRS